MFAQNRNIYIYTYVYICPTSRIDRMPRLHTLNPSGPHDGCKEEDSLPSLPNPGWSSFFSIRPTYRLLDGEMEGWMTSDRISYLFLSLSPLHCLCNQALYVRRYIRKYPFDQDMETDDCSGSFHAMQSHSNPESHRRNRIFPDSRSIRFFPHSPFVLLSSHREVGE